MNETNWFRMADMIKRHEGLRLTPYQCSAGDTTIGYGHNLTAHNEPIPESITKTKAEEYFLADVDEAEDGCRSVFPDFDDLSAVRQAVLIDMVFNLGIGRFRKFKNLIASVNISDWNQAGFEMFDSDWRTDVGLRCGRLMIMMISDVWFS